MRNEEQELIVARATAAGSSALAVIRLDGDGVRRLVKQMFVPRQGGSPMASPRRMVWGDWRDPQNNDLIDDGLTVFFSGPHSYTGNDLVEFHCHGGSVPVRRLIEAAMSLGARMAEPGEFTRRSFLNGRLDLAQAEAVADLINAQTDAAARLARGQLQGALSNKINEIRDSLITLAAEIEARLDFPEEGLNDTDRDRLKNLILKGLMEMEALNETQRRGHLFREGARVALVGAPNAGKSSLLNALARIERAIVTPHPGTTRDTIECTIDLHGIPVTLIDTAGLRESDDPVEQVGIARARQEIEKADLVVYVIDSTADIDYDRLNIESSSTLTVFNKIDLNPIPTNVKTGLKVSAVTGKGLKELELAISEGLLEGTAFQEESGLAVNLRHGELLNRAINSLRQAQQALLQDLSGEFIMVDLRDALDALSAILGLETGDAILDRIFSQFCLGK